MIAFVAALAHAGSFERLDLGEDRSTHANTICPDGVTVVGQLGEADGRTRGFAWSEAGVVEIDDLPGGLDFLDLRGCAGDTLVGVGYRAAGDDSEQVFVRKVGAGDLEDLGDIDGGIVQGLGLAVADDGTIVGGGYDATNDFVPVTWADGEFTALPLPVAEAARGTANGISADGAVIVGGLSLTRGGYPSSVGVRWDGAGIYELPDLADGWGYTSAQAVSANGRVAVGSVVSNESAYLGYEAARWVGRGPAERLGDVAGGGFESEALAVSGDGDVVVGRSITTDEGDEEAFVWTPEAGMLRLADVAGEAGVPIPDGVLLAVAVGVSRDGLVFAGTAVQDGRAFAYRLDLTPPPADTDVEDPDDTDVIDTADTGDTADTDDTDVAAPGGVIHGGCGGGASAWGLVPALWALRRRRRIG
jgi:probable HAF family extracellular repeat protein